MTNNEILEKAQSFDSSDIQKQQLMNNVQDKQHR